MKYNAEKFIKKSNKDKDGYFTRLFIEKELELDKLDMEFVDNSFSDDPEASYDDGVSFFYDGSIYSIDVDKIIKWIDERLSDEYYCEELEAKKLKDKIKHLKGYTIFCVEVKNDN